MKLLKAGCIFTLPCVFTLNTHAADIEISGAIEIEAGFSSDFNDTDSSDITLATVELGIDAKINDRVSGHLLLLHEDDDTEPMEVDEGVISIDLTNGWSLSAGRMYVPFGSYETNLISDPLTLELGETREAAALISYEADGLYGSVYAFNGDTIEAATPASEDTIEHFGASFGYVWENGDMSLDVGIDYISSLGDSDGISGNLPDTDADELPDPLVSYVGGMAFHANYTHGALSVIFEYVSSDDFDTTELTFNGQGASLSAFNLEAGYTYDWGSAAIGYQTTDEAAAIGLPETRILLAVSKEIFSATSLSFEYAMDDDYDTPDGTGNDGSTTTIQLAIEF